MSDIHSLSLPQLSNYYDSLDRPQLSSYYDSLRPTNASG